MLEFNAFLTGFVGICLYPQRQGVNLSLPSLLLCRSVEKKQVLNRDTNIPAPWKSYLGYDFHFTDSSKHVPTNTKHFFHKMVQDLLRTFSYWFGSIMGVGDEYLEGKSGFGHFAGCQDKEERHPHLPSASKRRGTQSSSYLNKLY